MKDKIFGLTWEQIQKAQQKQEFRETISGSTVLPKATPDDVLLLEVKGKEWLEKEMLCGVLDRLKNSGLI